MDAKQIITDGKTSLGIELGSTRIKAVLIDEKGTIYFVGYDGELRVWCAAAELRHHLNRLFQITNMVEIIKN